MGDERLLGGYLGRVCECRVVDGFKKLLKRALTRARGDVQREERSYNRKMEHWLEIIYYSLSLTQLA